MNVETACYTSNDQAKRASFFLLFLLFGQEFSSSSSSSSRLLLPLIQPANLAATPGIGMLVPRHDEDGRETVHR